MPGVLVPQDKALRARLAAHPGWIVFLVAFLIALIHFAVGSIHAPHDYFVLRGGMPWSDALAYHLAARDLVDGWGLRENHSFPMLFHAVRAPGYILFLATIYAWGLGRTAVVLVQLALHALTCAVVYRLGERAFGRRAGIFAGLTLALSGTHIDFAQMIMTETASAALMALALHFGTAERPRLVLAGVVTGAAALMRPTALLLTLLIPVYVLSKRRAGFLVAVACMGVALVPVGALSLRNGFQAGALSPAATYHVWTTWSEFAPPRPDSDDRNFAAFVPLIDKSEGEQQRFFRRAFVESALAAPRRLLRRAYHLFYSNLRVPLEQPLDAPALLGVPLLLLAGWGCTRARDSALAFVVGFWLFLTLAATALLGGSSGRFRLPFDWGLYLLVVGGLLRSIGREGDPPPPERVPSPLGPSVAAVLLLLVAAVPIVRVARLPDPERIELDPRQLGAEPLELDEVVRKIFTNPQAVEGKTVAWAGVIDPLTYVPANRSDDRTVLLEQRPYGRTLATFQVDGLRGPLDGRRVFLEIPDSLGYAGPDRARAVVTARIESTQNPSREKARLVATAIRPL